jgi:hypothetical protein
VVAKAMLAHGSNVASPANHAGYVDDGFLVILFKIPRRRIGSPLFWI